jgi:hypothetical protein
VAQTAERQSQRGLIGLGLAAPGEFTRGRLVPRRGALQLQHNGDRNRLSRMHTVVEVIPVVIANINIVSGIPVLRPVLWPRVNHQKRIAAVLEARVTPNYDGLAPDAKPVSLAEMETEAIQGNVVAAIAATLSPGAVIAFPM